MSLHWKRFTSGKCLVIASPPKSPVGTGPCALPPFSHVDQLPSSICVDAGCQAAFVTPSCFVFQAVDIEPQIRPPLTEDKVRSLDVGSFVYLFPSGAFLCIRKILGGYCGPSGNSDDAFKPLGSRTVDPPGWELCLLSRCSSLGPDFHTAGCREGTFSRRPLPGPFLAAKSI